MKCLKDNKQLDMTKCDREMTYLLKLRKRIVVTDDRLYVNSKIRTQHNNHVCTSKYTTIIE